MKLSNGIFILKLKPYLKIIFVTAFETMEQTKLSPQQAKEHNETMLKLWETKGRMAIKTISLTSDVLEWLLWDKPSRVVINHAYALKRAWWTRESKVQREAILQREAKRKAEEAQSKMHYEAILLQLAERISVTKRKAEKMHYETQEKRKADLLEWFKEKERMRNKTRDATKTA